VVRDNEEESLKLIDRWSMDALIPGEKELAILMRWEGRLTRELRLDELHLEHMKRQKRDERPSSRAAPAAVEEPLPSDISPLPRTGEGPGVRPLYPAEPESPGDFSLPSPLPRTGEGPGVRDLALRQLN